MSKKFDAHAYVERWDAIIIPVMISVILIALVLAVLLNIKTRPDCLRHEMVYCGTPSQKTYEADEEGHEDASAEHGHQAVEGAHP